MSNFECGKVGCEFGASKLHLVVRHRVLTHRPEDVKSDNQSYKPTDEPPGQLNRLVGRGTAGRKRRKRQMPSKYSDSYYGRSYNTVLRLNARNKSKETSRPNINKSQKVAKHFKNKCADTEIQAKKYRKMREINNKSSKKCREKKIKNIKENLKREDDYSRRNAELRETQKSLKDQINNLELLLKNDPVCNYIRQRMASCFSSLYTHNDEA